MLLRKKRFMLLMLDDASLGALEANACRQQCFIAAIDAICDNENTTNGVVILVQILVELDATS